MRALISLSLMSLMLAGCAGQRVATTPAAAPAPVTVRLIAFNDFHGALEAPQIGIEAPAADPSAPPIRVPAGGAAHLASAINALRGDNPNTLVVSAGDMIGATPLVSALFLDEPTIEAMDLIRVDYNAVGNHEFDKGRAELLRMQRGGCDKHTVREPCQLSGDFAGAKFGFLAANTLTEDGSPLFPAYVIREFGAGAGAAKVRVAIIGMTLKDTPSVVTPAGVAGLTFRDEADTVNALIPRLKAEGVNAIVVLVHQGATTKAGYNDKSCAGLGGDLPPILDRLDSAVDLVISGHTHQAYICEYGTLNPAKPMLLTSAGQYGTLLTDIVLTIDPVAGKVVSRSADNRIVQGEGFTGPRGEVPVSTLYPRYPADPAVAALVARYAEAAKPRAARVVGTMRGAATREATPAGESAAGALVADAQLAATRAADRGGAVIALMNGGGVRADLKTLPDGSVTYGALFAVQPFGNNLVVKTLTGAEIKAVLEQQFIDGQQQRTLFPSEGLRYSYDLSRPQGSRIVALTLNGQPLLPDQPYRVTMNNFLSSGGDGFTIFAQGRDALGGPQDVDALEAYIAANPGLTPPPRDRITKVGG